MTAPNKFQSSIYDELYRDKPYELEVRFLTKHIANIENLDVLELAGGTGNHAIHLAPLCRSYVHTDYSEEMSAIAQKKLGDIPQVKSVHVMNMTDFEPLKSQKFDVIICLFDSIGYLLNDGNIARALLNIREHLRDNGLLVVEYWNAGCFLRHYEKTRERQIEVHGSVVHRISTTEIDYSSQIASVHYRFFLEKGDSYGLIEETHSNRFFMPREFNKLLSEAGLRPKLEFEAYEDRPPDMNSWHILSIAEKK